MKHGRLVFPSIRIEGGLLPQDLIENIARGDLSYGGLTPEDYHLAAGERTGEAASRSWTRLTAAWRSFRDASSKLQETEAGTTITRERWLLILFQELGYGRLVASKAIELGGKTYPISHSWGCTPIHLVGCNVKLDRRTPGVAGASKASPHGMVQEFLNKSVAHRWAFVSNGLCLRILRDNASLTRQAYIEFDLQDMMEDELYPDFYVLWLVAHQSRVEGEKPEECILEKWMHLAREVGGRALDKLRLGVEDAISKLGSGFIAHLNNSSLREGLISGRIGTRDYYRELLRLVYRFIFLFVAEERGLLFAPDRAIELKDFYAKYYSLSRIRLLAKKKRGTRHSDLYEGIKVVMRIFGAKDEHNPLGLPCLGSFLWSREALPILAECSLSNAAFLLTIRSLTLMDEDRTQRRVDYSRLGTEELGSVYESLLELHPVMDTGAGSFKLEVAAGHERKTTGSYYTPTELLRSLLNTALEPVLNEAVKAPDPEKTLLGLNVLDPACGSGHFLIAASHRIALRLAAVRTGEEEPAPEAVRSALRDVISHCIYGVDSNPMAVELCKVGLWMEAIEPGKPLSFLDHRILCGNSLLGATPALIEAGIPDEAFEAIEGDDKKICSSYKKRNRDERENHSQSLFDVSDEPWEHLGNLAATMIGIESIEGDTMSEVEEKAKAYAEFVHSAGYLSARFLADAWCAAFVWKKNDSSQLAPITHDTFTIMDRNPKAVPEKIREEVKRLAHDYNFFHWHLEFPDVFRIPQAGEIPENEHTGWSGGFDAVLGNPPWEHIEIKEKEFFALIRPDIASAQKDVDRKKLIQKLKQDDPELYQEFICELRKHDGIGKIIGKSGLYPLCGRGRINLYAVFAECMKNNINNKGRVGAVLPTGIATDDTTKFYFQKIMEEHGLASLYDFENREGIFPGVHRSYKFCLITLTGKARPSKEADFVFFAQKYEDLADRERHFALSDAEIRLFNPNTRTCPVFRSKKDSELTKTVYRKVPVLIREGEKDENPWGVSFKQGLFNMATDSNLFRTLEQCERDGFKLSGNIFVKGSARRLPLYEAKMIHHYDHRWATYDGTNTRDVTLAEKQNPNYYAFPRYWVDGTEVEHALGERKKEWFIGWRDITRSTDERTCLMTLWPYAAAGDTFLQMFPSVKQTQLLASLVAGYSSFIFDYITRQKIGGIHLKYHYFKQLPVLPPITYAAPAPFDMQTTIGNWLLPRVLELTYTANDLEPFARDCGYDGPPFVWNEERRFLLRCEIDAAFFHLYAIMWDDVAYVMDTFPIVRRKDEKQYSTYRTKDTILDIYDAMSEAARSGARYATRLLPAPGAR